jgi:hypothetical protein
MFTTHSVVQCALLVLLCVFVYVYVYVYVCVCMCVCVCARARACACHHSVYDVLSAFLLKSPYCSTAATQRNRSTTVEKWSRLLA